MMNRKFYRDILTMCSGVIALASISPSASAQALGQASTYNVYVLTTDTANGNSQGAVAVGGDATFTSYTVGSALPTGSEPGLVVGGTVNGNSATIHGSVYANTVSWSDPTIYGNANGNTVNLSNSGTVSGNVTYGTSYSNSNTGVSGTVSSAPLTVPINFTNTSSYLTNASSTWGAATPTSSTVDYYNGITLTGTSPTLNVFDITGSQVNSENNMTINAPAGSTVLVNIAGTNDSWAGGLSINGVSNANVIYNFYQAINLTLVNVGINGALLAPGASVNFTGGQVNGNLIAGSLYGNGTENNGGSAANSYLFSGTLPSVMAISVVPEPSPATALLIGLFGTACLVRLNRRRSAAL